MLAFDPGKPAIRKAFGKLSFKGQENKWGQGWMAALSTPSHWNSTMELKENQTKKPLSQTRTAFQSFPLQMRTNSLMLTCIHECGVAQITEVHWCHHPSLHAGSFMSPSPPSTRYSSSCQRWKGIPRICAFSHLCYHTATINRHCAASKYTEENHDSNKIFGGTQCTVRQKLVNSRTGWRFEILNINTCWT